MVGACVSGATGAIIDDGVSVGATVPVGDGVPVVAGADGAVVVVVVVVTSTHAIMPTVTYI